jgi:hypothetical protein
VLITLDGVAYDIFDDEKLVPLIEARVGAIMGQLNKAQRNAMLEDLLRSTTYYAMKMGAIGAVCAQPQGKLDRSTLIEIANALGESVGLSFCIPVPKRPPPPPVIELPPSVDPATVGRT